ncbi:MAG: hypothetical protein WED00_16950 [Aquisalimonadaceae bacterium]
MACCNMEGPEAQLLAVHHVPESSGDARSRELMHTVRRLGYSGLRCQWLMVPDHYQIVQIDAPDVPEAELVDAARWRIRDLVRIPIKDAVIDGFLVPDERVSGAPGKLYMVASRRADAERVTARISAAGLRPDMLGIPELALRNLAALHPEQQGGLAMLAVSAGDTLLTISRGETLFLCRWLDAGMDELSGGGVGEDGARSAAIAGFL